MRPHLSFSLIVPLFKTERYLPDLLRSLDAQVIPGQASVECIFVDDGSPDCSADIAREWLSGSRFAGRVVAQENRGVSVARNTGLDHATGDWIGFPDSDDFYAEGVIEALVAFLVERGDRPALLSMNVRRYWEESGKLEDDHPLRVKFSQGDRIVSLQEHPQCFQTQAASAFFNGDLVRSAGIRFVEGLKAAEDVVFASEVLLAAEEPIVGCVASAVYGYRQRAAQDSAVNLYKFNPDFYVGRFERGYRPVFDRAAVDERVPQWLGFALLYDLSWFFPGEMRPSQKAKHLSGAERARVLSLVGALLERIDDEWIANYDLTLLPVEIRCLFRAMRGTFQTADQSVRIVHTDRRRELVELRYYVGVDDSDEIVRVAGERVEPVAAKYRALDYFGQRVLRERIIWVPADDELTVDLEGQRMSFSRQASTRLSRTTLTRRDVRLDKVNRPGELPSPATVDRSLSRRLAGRIRREAIAWFPRLFDHSRAYDHAIAMREKRHTYAVQVLAQRPSQRRRYRDAWLFIDRTDAADDNAEYLYWYVRDQHPEINAWFVLAKDSKDWRRLRRAGARLLEFGSMSHKFALLHAEAVLSAHADVESIRPIPDRYYWEKTRPWEFVYLEHGVLQHDLSTWFNTKRFDLMTTASVDEHESLLADDTPYQLTSASVELTGFPRHDLIVERAASAATLSERRLLLFAPTWRSSMLTERRSLGGERRLLEDVQNSEFGRQWLTLLNDPRLERLAESHHAQVAFLPHPNLRRFMRREWFAPHVEIIDVVQDLTGLLLDSRVVVTDYSSITFEAAVAGAHVNYFQTDSAAFFAEHTYMPGYWSYERHGFGPVSTTRDDLVDRIGDQLGKNEVDERYARRVVRTLPYLDGRSRERIVRAVYRRLGKDPD